jgi:hypothetical protein
MPAGPAKWAIHYLDIVRVECDPDGGHEREEDERRYDNGYRQQQPTRDRGDQAATAECARHAQAQRHVGEQVDRGAVAQAERRDRVEIVADITTNRAIRKPSADARPGGAPKALLEGLRSGALRDES